MTSLDVAMCFIWLSCTVIGYTQVGAEGKENQTVLKEDLKRSLFFLSFSSLFFFYCFSKFSWGFCAPLYVFVVGEIVWDGLGLLVCLT